MKRIIYVFLFCFIVACSSENKKTKIASTDIQWVNVDLNYAQNFILERNLRDENTFRVSIINPFLHDTVTYITAENTRSLVMMANNMGFLSALDLQDDVVAVSRYKYIYDSILNSKIDADMVIEVGDMVSINKELVYDVSPDYIISSGFQNTHADLIWLPSNVSALITYEWLENHPLATLEWIKLYGALFGEFDKSITYFELIKDNYEKIKSESLIDYNKSILSGSLYGDVWYTPGGNSYKGVLYRDANVSYAYEHDKTTGSIPLSVEEVFDAQVDADFWCASLQVNTIKELIKLNPIYKEFSCVKKKNVYMSNGLVNDKNINGFWEIYQVRPDLYLNDIIIMANDSTNIKELKLFKKLD